MANFNMQHVDTDGRQTWLGVHTVEFIPQPEWGAGQDGPRGFIRWWGSDHIGHAACADIATGVVRVFALGSCTVFRDLGPSL